MVKTLLFAILATALILQVHNVSCETAPDLQESITATQVESPSEVSIDSSAARNLQEVSRSTEEVDGTNLRDGSSRYQATAELDEFRSFGEEVVSTSNGQRKAGARPVKKAAPGRGRKEDSTTKWDARRKGKKGSTSTSRPAKQTTSSTESSASTSTTAATVGGDETTSSTESSASTSTTAVTVGEDETTTTQMDYPSSTAEPSSARLMKIDPATENLKPGKQTANSTAKKAKYLRRNRQSNYGPQMGNYYWGPQQGMPNYQYNVPYVNGNPQAGYDRSTRQGMEPLNTNYPDYGEVPAGMGVPPAFPQGVAEALVPPQQAPQQQLPQQTPQQQLPQQAPQQQLPQQQLPQQAPQQQEAPAVESPMESSPAFGFIGGYRLEMDAVEIVNFVDVVDKFRQKIEANGSYGSITTIDFVGNHKEPQAVRYRIKAWTDDSHQSEWGKPLQFFTQQAFSHMRWYHNPEEGPTHVSYKQQPELNLVNEWKVTRDLYLGIKHKIYSSVPCDFSEFSNDKFTVYLGLGKSEVMNLPNDYMADISFTAEGFRSYKITYAVQTQEVIVPYSFDIIIGGYVLLCFDKQSNGFKCWGFPVHLMEDDRFEKVGNNLKFVYRGIFHGTRFFEQTLTIETYEWEDSWENGTDVPLRKLNQTVLQSGDTEEVSIVPIPLPGIQWMMSDESNEVKPAQRSGFVGKYHV